MNSRSNGLFYARVNKTFYARKNNGAQPYSDATPPARHDI
ncbi:transposase [Salmonella phage 37]|uniref:Transposase n=1 Tax=Salmonella phage 37 TaxID=1654890 RepID=A0A0N6WGB8_9CAUD|nr:transposase [Salmonella phage 37]AKJ73959.1 transposase [Salmonella phage 37]